MTTQLATAQRPAGPPVHATIADESLAAIVAHELESSLIVVSLYAQRLLASDPPLSDTQAEYVERIRSFTERMRQVSADVTAYARADAVLDLGPVSLREVVDEAVATLAPLFDDRRAVLVVDETLPTLVGDRGQLVQLFRNLISNAIKFGPRGGRVTITSDHVRAGWRLAVSDQGPGIPEESRRAIFEPFERLAATRAEPGAGLGLAVCRRVADNHGATLTVEGGPGTGATFVLTLPDRPRLVAAR